ncbi:MAG TPA: trypsin-like peptidase domain-containing protein [Candidatus Saccharimonadales bacterium]|nr:trypsin-like peptidase domain-containing protein [Candidatus Saccharimonadales bacterium]
MAVKDNDETELKQAQNYSVSSRPDQRGRTISVRVPDIRRPQFDRNQLRDPRLWPARIFIVAILLASLIFGYIGSLIQNSQSNGGVVFTSLGGQKKIVSSQSLLINQIAKTVGPSVVSVNVNITSPGSNTTGLGLYGFSEPTQEQAAGTGIIISSDGLIITNRHVVPAGTTSVSVTLSDGTELKDVKVIGRTNSSDSLDIAFLKITNAEGHKLTPAVIGNSSQVEVGDEVVAIGNALGQFQNTVTSGIISGYGRSVTAGSSGGGSSTENLDDLFQTDAAINEGNSGGPLVNLNGQVIGINTAIAGNAQNIGFAIPVNDVKGLIEQVIKTGKFARPYLGVRYVPLTSDVANTYNLGVSSGAFIAPSSDPTNPSVIPGSPADNAGLTEGEVITAVNGTPINQQHSLTSLLDQHQPGDTVNLTIWDKGKTMQVNVTLGTMPNS